MTIAGGETTDDEPTHVAGLDGEDEDVQSPMDRLKIHIESLTAGVIIHLEGDIDFTTTELLRQQVITAALSQTPPRVVLEMSQVRHCDSSGLGALIAIYRAVNTDAGRLVLACLTDYCREMLRRTGLDLRFTISNTLPDALTLLTTPSGPLDQPPEPR